MTRETLIYLSKTLGIFGVAYQANNYLNFSAQYLHGSQISLTAKVNVNPIRPPLPGGRELAPVPMRTRSEGLFSVKQSNENNQMSTHGRSV